MRSSNWIRTLETALLAAPLLAAACGSSGVGDTTMTGTPKVPTCTAGQALSTDSSGNIICKKLPDGATVLPKCDATLEALTSTTAGVACTQRNTGSEDPSITNRVTVADSKVTDFGTRVDKVAAAGGSGGGFKSFAGLSVNTYSGHIKLRAQAYLADVVQDNGLLAASNVCAKDFGAGARICTVGDVVNSAINGKLVRTTLMTEDAWIYNVAFQNPLGSSPVNGLGDNCAGYTYETADAKWVGTSFRWRAAESANAAGKGDVSPNFFLVGCNTSRKIACCK